MKEIHTVDEDITRSPFAEDDESRTEDIYHSPFDDEQPAEDDFSQYSDAQVDQALDQLRNFQHPDDVGSVGEVEYASIENATIEEYKDEAFSPDLPPTPPLL